MSFAVAAESYDRFMGRYSVPLAPQTVDLAGVDEGQTALDVGCGPGALTGELVRRLGPAAVGAVDPSEQFVAATRERYPGVTVEQAAAESLPLPDSSYDSSLAQLVVHFMSDPVAGLTEMKRVTRDGGVVAACVWDHAGGRGPLSLFWDAARHIDPELEDEGTLPGTRQGHLGALFREAGLEDVEESILTVELEHPSFEEWWEPYTMGVGPAGKYLTGLDSDRRDRVREQCRALLPSAPFVQSAVAWAARGIA